jgi:diguanylate cyclase (GGDEF)-like protein
MSMYKRDWRLSLTAKVALLSLVPILIMGFVLARVLQAQIVTRALRDADQSAQLLAHIGIQPQLSPADLRDGLSTAGVRALDNQLRARSTTQNLARIKIWNTADTVIYSDDHRLIGRRITPSDDLRDALKGAPHEAEVTTPSAHTETASEVGLGQLVEVYVPLRFNPAGPPVGAFEIYLSYKPIASAVSRDKRMIALLIFIGLALLWAVLFRIVASASRRLRRQADENDRLARYDQLTGLPNRTLFIERVARALSRGEHERTRARRSDGVLAVLLIDLDGFKEINDTLGHSTGDAALCEVAHRLNGSLGSDAFVARLGGDEYGILQAGASLDAHALAANVQACLEQPVVLDDVAVNIEASVGVALAPEHAEDLHRLLRHADVALDRAKSHRGRVEFYSADHDHFSTGRLQLLGQVRGALKRGEFVLHYQPQADLRSGRIVGVEALLRWEHPEHGLLAPMRFIPLIEQTALVGPVTLHVIDEALAQMVRWRAVGLRVPLSVNLSARNLLDPELPSRVAGLLSAHGADPGELTVEVTESATMADTARAVGVLGALRDMGLGVSIDDFGTGHASFAYLAQLPANEIKIDRSFITGMCERARDEAIVRSTIDLARNLELRVVAEGIETLAVWEHLASLGCDLGQGYLMSKPLPAEQLASWLSEHAGAFLPTLATAETSAAVPSAAVPSAAVPVGAMPQV